MSSEFVTYEPQDDFDIFMDEDGYWDSMEGMYDDQIDKVDEGGT